MEYDEIQKYFDILDKAKIENCIDKLLLININLSACWIWDRFGVSFQIRINHVELNEDEVIKYLKIMLSKGFDIDTYLLSDLDKSNLTLLHLFSSHNIVKVMSFLIDNGADINKQTRDGKTPFMKMLESIANYNKLDKDIVVKFINKGLDLKLKDNFNKDITDHIYKYLNMGEQKIIFDIFNKYHIKINF